MPRFARELLPNLLVLALASWIGQTAGAQSISAPGPGQSAPRATQAVIQATGQRVVEIRVLSDKGEVLQDNPSDLALKPGQAFTLDSERQTLRQLYRTGVYANLTAQIASVPGGIRLDYVALRNFFIDEVRIEGLREPPSESLALSSMRLSLGAVFLESDLPAAIDRLRQTLQADGFYDAKITYRLSPNEKTRQMNIYVCVETGERARLGAVTIVNQTAFTDVQLRDRLKLKPNTQITSDKLERSRERERKWLVAQGYLATRVNLTRSAYDASKNEVPLEIDVVGGPNVRVQVEGAKISTRTLRTLVPVYEEGAVDEDLLQEGRRNIRDFLQRDGYFDAEVSYTTSIGPAARTAPNNAAASQSEIITYDVNRGRRRRLVGIAFAGNHYFNQEILRSRVHLQPAAFASRGRFSTEQLATDTSSLIALYQANGFRSVQVKNELLENYRGKPGDLFVRFDIVEGPQTLVYSLTLDGNQHLSDDQLLGVIGSTEGQPFSDSSVASDRDNVLALYYDRGFPQAALNATVDELPPEPNRGPRVKLTYHIMEGTQLLVSSILVNGYEHTHLRIIERQIQLKPGQPLSESAVVETQRQLYNLGVFNRVAIAPQNPSGTDPDKVVQVLTEEARRYTLAYGLGLEAQRLGSASAGPTAEPLRFSPRATFEISKLNLTGRADTLSFKARASTLQGRAGLGYNAPKFAGRKNWNLQLNALYDKTRDVQTFTSTRSEGSIQLSDHLTIATTVSFRYVYRHVVASDLNSTVTPEEIPLFSQPTEVSFFGFTWLRDRRDSPADPTRGSFNTFNIDLVSRSIGASASFVRSSFQNATYSPVGKRFTFARSTRFGVERPYQGSEAIDVPLPERFFAGGGTTLRGFGLNQAGPRDPDTGFPVGGLAMLVFNQQLQFPMRLPWIGNRVGGAVFYDAGNVFSSVGAISLRLSPIKPVFDPAAPNICVSNCTNDLNYFSHTIGFELRYHTPVGPVSVDLAYQLNPANFLIPTGSTTGPCATAVCVQSSRLPAFQFFVNLGPTF